MVWFAGTEASLTLGDEKRDGDGTATKNGTNGTGPFAAFHLVKHAILDLSVFHRFPGFSGQNIAGMTGIEKFPVIFSIGHLTENVKLPKSPLRQTPRQ